jgi:hypothetical protein
MRGCYSPAVRRHESHSHLPAHFSIAFSGLYRGSFVPGVNQANVALGTSNKKCIEMSTVNPERDFDPQRPQALCEQISSNEFALLRLLENQWRHLRPI